LISQRRIRDCYNVVYHHTISSLVSYHPMPLNIPSRSKGILAALTSALLLGTSSTLGKQAIELGISPMAVVMLRTVAAALLLIFVLPIFRRGVFSYYPIGLIGCLLAGVINGFGSIFYYDAISRIDLSLGQLLYMMYPLFVAFWLWLDNQPPSRITMARFLLIIPAIILLTQASSSHIDWLGIVEMLAAAALYALHLPINQRVLQVMPAPTVTLYTLFAMSVVLLLGFFLTGTNLHLSQQISQGSIPVEAWWAVIGMTLVTFFSRLALFMGVKYVGGMQTSILGLMELMITLTLAQLWLGERLSNLQWIGAVLLVASLMMVSLDRSRPQMDVPKGWLSWLRKTSVPVELSRHHRRKPAHTK